MSMINTKSGVKAFVNPSNQPVTPSVGSDGKPMEYTPEDLKKLGGENVGEVLNKVADANWIDPRKKLRTIGNDKLDKDAFFRLMLTQMKNQDPTNPLKSHEMAAQLASFSTLEQMQNMNTTLTDMKNGQKPTEQFQALNLIGKSVAGDSARVYRAKGDKDHQFIFELPNAAKQMTLEVKNSEGQLVRKYDLKNLKAGENTFTWNGEDDKGNVLPLGDYYFMAEAVDGFGKKMAVKSEFSGMITGINFSNEGPVLMVGNQAVRMKDVRRIIDPSLKNNDQKLEKNNAQDLKTGALKSETETKTGGAGEPAKKTSDLLTQVGMSQDMINRLAKETDQGI